MRVEAVVEIEVIGIVVEETGTGEKDLAKVSTEGLRWAER